MEKLNNIKPLNAKVEVEYTGTDSEGNTLILTETIEPDASWTALLLRYIEDHRTRGQYCNGAKELSLQGSAGEFPKVEDHRWLPEKAFNG